MAANKAKLLSDFFLKVLQEPISSTPATTNFQKKGFIGSGTLRESYGTGKKGKSKKIVLINSPSSSTRNSRSWIEPSTIDSDDEKVSFDLAERLASSLGLDEEDQYGNISPIFKKKRRLSSNFHTSSFLNNLNRSSRGQQQFFLHNQQKDRSNNNESDNDEDEDEDEDDDNEEFGDGSASSESLVRLVNSFSDLSSFEKTSDPDDLEQIKTSDDDNDDYDRDDEDYETEYDGLENQEKERKNFQEEIVEWLDQNPETHEANQGQSTASIIEDIRLFAPELLNPRKRGKRTASQRNLNYRNSELEQERANDLVRKLRVIKRRLNEKGYLDPENVYNRLRFEDVEGLWWVLLIDDASLKNPDLSEFLNDMLNFLPTVTKSSSSSSSKEASVRNQLALLNVVAQRSPKNLPLVLRKLPFVRDSRIRGANGIPALALVGPIDQAYKTLISNLLSSSNIENDVDNLKALEALHDAVPIARPPINLLPQILKSAANQVSSGFRGIDFSTPDSPVPLLSISNYKGGNRVFQFNDQRNFFGAFPSRSQRLSEGFQRLSEGSRRLPEGSRRNLLRSQRNLQSQRNLRFAYPTYPKSQKNLGSQNNPGLPYSTVSELIKMLAYWGGLKEVYRKSRLEGLVRLLDDAKTFDEGAPVSQKNKGSSTLFALADLAGSAVLPAETGVISSLEKERQRALGRHSNTLADALDHTIHILEDRVELF